MSISYLILMQTEPLGSQLGTHPAKILFYYIALALIAAIIYLAIEYQDPGQRAKVVRVLKVFSFIHIICPLCVLARRYKKSRFSMLIRMWGRVCPFCSIYRIVKREENR